MAQSLTVALFIFRRPEQTARVFEAIRAARPEKLFIIADGPREHRPDDAAAVVQTRSIVERIDWPCEVKREYAPRNMGCKPRVGAGLEWVFQQVEEVIILEDDCMPHPSFFQYCQELLARYREDSRIGWISGTDLQLGRRITDESYHFARNAHIWGWASWRRAWRDYDANLQQWPALRNSGWLGTLYDDPKQIEFWTSLFDQAHRGQTAWDVPWLFSNWAKGRFNVVPNVNIISNIGFAAGATGNIAGLPPIFHGLFADAPARQMPFPLRHPQTIELQKDADDFSLRAVGPLDADYLRRKMVRAWVEADPTEFSQRLQTDWPAAAMKFLGSGISKPLLPDAEDRALQDMILRKMGVSVTTSNQSPSIQELLSSMLYFRADQMPNLPLDLEKLPQWLQSDYLRYLHEQPALFTEPRESEQYAAFLDRWMDTLWQNIQHDPVADVWSSAAITFLQMANFIGVYFSKQNLRSLYEKRGRLLEGILRGLGHSIDYQFPPRPTDRRKIRLGILASHYAPQTETYTTLPVYKHLSRDRYEIILFTASQSGHRMERYCAGHADSLISLPQDIPTQVQTIRAADLDVLWIGTNVTAVSNPTTLLSVFRLGRVQVTSTSSCTTTGMRHVDYYISGSMCEPADAQAQYTEKLLLMDGPAHCMDFGAEAQPLATLEVSRSSIGVAGDEILFASGANFYKVIPEVQAVWVKILAAAPRAKLLLYPFNANWSNAYPVNAFIERFRHALKDAGIDENRLIVLPPAPSRADVLNRLRIADLYLDSFPFSGVNSLLDPLEVALPPIVMEGNSFRSLMAPSLMRELKVPELIAVDEASYIDQAVRLAHDANARAEFSGRIREAMSKRPRFVNSEWYSSEVDRLLTAVLKARGM